MHRFTYATLALALACSPGDGTTTDGSTSGSTSADASTGGGSTTDETPTTTVSTTSSVDPSTTTTVDPSTTSVGPSTTDATTTDATTTDATTTDGESTGGEEMLVLVPGFEVPESVHWSAEDDAWFVSNIVGMPVMKDGNGYISRLNADGSVAAMKWAEGLDGPAGLRAADGVLYAADIDVMRAFDTDTAMEIDATMIPGAVFLNDVFVGPDEFVYVSDVLGNTIYRYQIGLAPEIVLQDPSLDAPNGLNFVGDQLIIGAIGSISDPGVLGELLMIEGDMAVQQGIFEGKIDGIELDGDDLLLTEFSGQLRHVSPDGNGAILIRDFVADQTLMSTADLGFDPVTRVAGIPDFLGGVVAFYTVP